MTTKGLSRKQVIVPMNSDVIKRFMNESSNHVANLNRTLKNMKMDVMIDFICSDPLNIMIITNKITLTSDLQIIKNYVKTANSIDSNGIKVPWLLQSKSYLKIIGIPYFHKVLLSPITSKDIEDIIKQNQIFNNIALASKPYIIKVSSKSDMAIIWLDIWDVQSGSKAKSLINRCFNVGNNIATIREWIWTLVYTSAKTARNGSMHSHAGFKERSVSNTTDHTNQNITITLHGTAKQIRRPTSLS